MTEQQNRNLDDILQDIIRVLEWSVATKTPTGETAAALQRLRATKPAAIDNRPDGERRAEALERAKGPKNGGNGVVLPPPGPKEVAKLELERKQLAERAERQKRPLEYRR
jgi:hypothetical protein